MILYQKFRHAVTRGCHFPDMARSIAASRFLYGQPAQSGRSPGAGGEAGAGDVAFAAGSFEVSEPSPFNPNSQSAEHACTRQMVASISELGEDAPLS